jgi:hypothetical protein
MRPALHMLDAMALELRFELRAPSPGRVLTALIGEDLPWRTVLGDAARQRFEHEHASLVMCHRQAHQIPGVIVQERRHIDPLVATKQEGEQVRLPQLVGLSALKVLHLDLPSDPSLGRLRLDAFCPQHPPHCRLGGADPQEPSHHITDAAAAGMRVCVVCGEHRLRPLIRRLLEVRVQRRLLYLERLFSTLPIRLHPHHRGRVRHA